MTAFTHLARLRPRECVSTDPYLGTAADQKLFFNEECAVTSEPLAFSSELCKFTPPPRRPRYVGFARTFGRATAPNLTAYLQRSLAYYTALKKITPTPAKEEPPQERNTRE